MLKFPRKKVGEQGKRNRKEGKQKEESKEEGMERKGKDQGEKGNGIYLGSIMRKKEKARKKKQKCRACYQEGKKFFEL